MSFLSKLWKKPTSARARYGVRRLGSELRDTEARLAESLREVIHTTRNLQAALGQRALPASRLWKGALVARSATRPPEKSGYTSMVCRESHFKDEPFGYWAGALDAAPRYHRKLWEWVYICQVLYERNMLEPGRRGLGFGVGREGLPALFASRGCELVVTDMAVDEAISQGWTNSGSHSEGLDALQNDRICEPDVFLDRATHRVVDMNDIPSELTGFDFCWSACSLEHLGSLENGLRFVERSLDTLVAGGVAVHTTEFNLSSDTDTLESPNTCIYRESDLQELIANLTAAGHHVEPLDLEPGSGEVEAYVDLPPYRQEPHLRLALEGFVTTSVGLIITKGKPAAE